MSRVLVPIFVMLGLSTLTATSEEFLKLDLQRKLQDHGPFREIASVTRESDGVFWTTIRIGSPPQQQSFSVIVTTGSDKILVPCSNCNNCGPVHQRFNSVNSSSVSWNPHDTFTQCYS